MQVLNVSMQFYEAQRSGKLPRISNTPWRGNSHMYDSIILPNGEHDQWAHDLLVVLIDMQASDNWLV